MGGKASRLQRRAAQIQAERAAKEARMKKSGGKSRYALKQQTPWEKRVAAEDRRKKGITMEEWQWMQNSKKESLNLQIAELKDKINHQKQTMEIMATSYNIEKYQVNIRQLESRLKDLQKELESIN